MEDLKKILERGRMGSLDSMHWFLCDGTRKESFRRADRDRRSDKRDGLCVNLRNCGIKRA
jgi:hypothetical protein